ncbi:hypothetical protein LHK_01650 [Laribacter hongkongensis HLHK9]|uniref:Uncharacterized protein n=1 Tax=Laribacter hongkongensis (strain HLHK9) TaxID=557598 RepID=C1D846_LARHH|nr:hypothetical protein [Laribacter hongkongensis]ACO74636.1 hypothetical protein LHK_01650 [Laribacter hongkongensis HLHK9]
MKIMLKCSYVTRSETLPPGAEVDLDDAEAGRLLDAGLAVEVMTSQRRRKPAQRPAETGGEPDGDAD